MALIENRIVIERSLTDVFQKTTDFESYEEWQPGLNSVNVTSGKPIRAGTILTFRRQFMGGEIFVNADVIDFQRNKRYELKGIHGRFQFTRAVEFTPGGRETTIYDRMNLRIPWFYFWYTPFVTSALKSRLSREWDNLKTLLESQS